VGEPRALELATGRRFSAVFGGELPHEEERADNDNRTNPRGYLLVRAEPRAETLRQVRTLGAWSRRCRRGRGSRGFSGDAGCGGHAKECPRFNVQCSVPLG